MSKTKLVFSWLITILASAMPLYGAYGKFFNPGMQSYMASHGYEKWTTMIGFGELASVLLFILPKTHKVGILLMSALMGGAIATHMSHGEPFTMQIGVLLLVWLSAFLRGNWLSNYWK